MKGTLYDQIKNIDFIDEDLKDLESYNSVDVTGMQQEIFQKYETNPVLIDAIVGRQSIEESLKELGKVNKGIKKILPWRKNKAHNERLKHLGELVDEPYHLSTSGILTPDNLITATAEFGVFVFGLSYFLSKYLLGPDPVIEDYQQNFITSQFFVPAITSLIVGPVFGFMVNYRRFSGLPTDEAIYLDGKVQEFYK